MVRLKRYIALATTFVVAFVLTTRAARPYSLSVLGTYGYNTTWQHFGGGELKAYMPLNANVELEAAFEGLSSNVYTASATLRPKFAVPVGEMFVDASVLYKAVQRNRMHNAAGALSLGYRMDYVSLQVGCFTQMWADYGRMWNSEEEYVIDALNVLYRLSVNVRPLCERWNIYFGVSDYTELEYERMWQPIFFLGAYYDFPPSSNFEYEYNAASHFRLLAEVLCKPTGMFHLNASFYGAKVKVGFAYKF
ncbi:MAG: hypothetical protein IJS13_04260 [Paludibacteraceae bacterium]|nr:hypothetical protein [Paludibacteraceae bacterium]